MAESTHAAIPDDFTSSRRNQREQANALRVKHESELTECIEAEESYRVGGVSREGFVDTLEKSISDRPDLADAIRTIWATAWHDDRAEAF
ncbi:hypothetical protein [Devosia sp. Leaf64]|uniref:hypothetical protein n=1 Tax=Devosia sp. Leaf64 TaxID=1736229 RepID=UPI000713BB1C|nr:hypothetical protein [Devosia sp. Leaf64]KQN72409.1 hypothetical protein ASE94_07805 [Devosia sp. Leaf64]